MNRLLINARTYNNVIAQDDKEEIGCAISLDWLNADPDNHYYTGKNGIANAYIPYHTVMNENTPDNIYRLVSDGQQYLKINQKNAFYAILFATAYKCQCEDEKRANNMSNYERRANGLERIVHSFDALFHKLLPRNGNTANISDPCFRRIFSHVGTADDIRNFQNSVAFKTIFNTELVTRYTCKKKSIGDEFLEDEIREIDNRNYQEALAIAQGAGARLGNTVRALIQQHCAEKLLSETGWAYDYREYTSFGVNWDLINAIKAAFPWEASCVEESAERLMSIANIRDRNELRDDLDENPIAGAYTYQKSLLRGFNRILRIIGLKDRDTFYEKLMEIPNPTPVDKMRIWDKVMTQKIYNFVHIVNDGRRATTNPYLTADDDIKAVQEIKHYLDLYVDDLYKCPYCLYFFEDPYTQWRYEADICMALSS